MAKGIIGQVQLFATVALAAPVGLMGVSKLLDGQRLLGVGFLAVALAMVAVEEYVTRPTDVAGEAAQSVASAVVDEPDDEE
ncbi:MAG: hypothetical protein ABEJ31_11540 [Haloarculaceae archaeon]